MDLLEHQGKALFAGAGLPVLPSRLAFSPAEARAAAGELRLPVVVKAQVKTGGRGKAGGIRVCATEGEVAAAAAKNRTAGPAPWMRRRPRVSVVFHVAQRPPKGALRCPTMIRRPGVAQAGLTYLDETDKAAIYAAALEIMSTIGMRVHHAEALELLRDAGCGGDRARPGVHPA